MKRTPTLPQKIAIANRAALERWVQAWTAGLQLPTVVCLYGELGVGKTQFCQFMAQSLGHDEVTASPTFVIHNRLNLRDLTLEHLDLYRLTSDEDLESTGFWDLFAEQKL